MPDRLAVLVRCDVCGNREIGYVWLDEDRQPFYVWLEKWPDWEPTGPVPDNAWRPTGPGEEQMPYLPDVGYVRDYYRRVPHTQRLRASFVPLAEVMARPVILNPCQHHPAAWIDKEELQAAYDRFDTTRRAQVVRAFRHVFPEE